MAVPFLAGWNKRKKLTITGTTVAQSNYQTKLKLVKSTSSPPPPLPGWSNYLRINIASAILLTNYQKKIDIQGSNPNAQLYVDFSLVKPNGDDIRFINSSGNQLDYWIESWDDIGLTASIWVEVDSSAASSVTTIYLYYNNPSASSASNGRNTFLVFDDFATGSSEIWTMTAGVTSDRVTNHRLNINGANGTMSARLDFGTDIGDVEVLFDFIRLTNNPSSGMGFSIQDTVYTGYPQGAGDSIGLFDHAIGSGAQYKWNYLRNNGVTNNIVSSPNQGVAGIHYWVKITRLNNIITYEGYSDSSRTTLVWSLSNTQASLTGLRYIYLLQGLLDTTNNVQGWITNIRISKSTLTEIQEIPEVEVTSNDNFSDIRFTEQDGTTPLNYWLQEYTPGVSAIVFVKVTSIPATPNTTDIYIYYNNPSALSASDGRNTFIVFDDFKTGSSEQWTTVDGATIDRATNHRIDINGITGSPKAYLDKLSDIGDYEFLFDHMKTSVAASEWMGVATADSNVGDQSTRVNSIGAYDGQRMNSSIQKWCYLRQASTTYNTSSIIGTNNTHYWDKLTRINGVHNYKGYSDSSRIGLVWNVSTTRNGIINQRYIFAVDTLVDVNIVTGWITNIIIRTLASPEPTVSLGTEELKTTTTLKLGNIFSHIQRGISFAEGIGISLGRRKLRNR